jgi:uncharacterized repeat protein (TIGR03803 family)
MAEKDQNVRNLFARPRGHFRLLVTTLLGVSVIGSGTVKGQAFAPLCSFSGSNGALPRAGLVASGGALYGTSFGGGSWGRGAVFVVNRNGTGLAALYNFTGGSDGGQPSSALVLAGGTLYGTTVDGGGANNGTLFSINTNGAGFATLHDFSAGTGVFPTITNSDGVNPFAGLILSGNFLYGTTFNGGGSGRGTVFAIHTDGTGFTNLYAFTAGTGAFPNIINSDGAYPRAGLVLSGNTLFGVATGGGTSGAGTVFAVNTDGSVFRTLYSFTATSSNTNSDGAGPGAALVLAGDLLFGTAEQGGSSGIGTVFAINTNGTGFTNLHSFMGSDGAKPLAGLVLSDGTLFGTTWQGGSASNGVVFSIGTNGTAFTTIHNLAAGTGAFPVVTNSDGAFIYGSLILSGNDLLGVASSGGGSADGTIFTVTLPAPPMLAATVADGSFVVTWPTNISGFTLQSSAAPDSLTGWTAVSPDPVVVNGQYTSTNAISGVQRFFRLGKN